MVTQECKAVDYAITFSSNNSTWIVVAMTTDRCLAIVKPLSVSKWRSPAAVKYVLVLIFLFSCCWSIPYLFTAAIVNGQCVIVSGECFYSISEYSQLLVQKMTEILMSLNTLQKWLKPT